MEYVYPDSPPSNESLFLQVFLSLKYEVCFYLSYRQSKVLPMMMQCCLLNGGVFLVSTLRGYQEIFKAWAPSVERFIFFWYFSFISCSILILASYASFFRFSSVCSCLRITLSQLWNFWQRKYLVSEVLCITRCF